MSNPDDVALEPAGPRYTDGWRAGKLIEDPDKTKRWGWVGARPSEYLVCTRRGQIDRRRSGQGARIWKWPWQAISIIPTTLQRIEFVADQVTRERVGVQVAGIAVYRIAEPELAFRVLNFSFGEAANEKLATTLREMFIGASRRLIANLTLDDCLTRRKEALAAYLMTEIAPVVSGRGAIDDATDCGWGVVLDTIEIQDVRIQSAQVFAHLQAPYRAEIAARAELAELERQQQIALRRAETSRSSDEAKLLAVRDTRAMRARTEAEAAESEAKERMRADAAALRVERERVLAQIATSEEQRRAHAAAEVAAIAAEAARAEAMFAEEVRELERVRARAATTQHAELERRRDATALERELREADAEAAARISALDDAHRRRVVELELLTAPERLQHALITVGLPQLAAAFQQRFGEIHYTQVGNGDGPTAPIAQALAQIFALARSLGLDVTALGRRGE